MKKISLETYDFLVILSTLLLSSSSVNADIAPIEVIGNGAYGIFTNQSDIMLEKFFVEVHVNLPDVYEEYTYYLKNNQNKTIKQTVIIPYVFDIYKHNSFREGNISLKVNGKDVKYARSKVKIDDEDLVENMSHYIGYLTDITFLPLEGVEVKLVARSHLTDYTESFKYFYSAKTSKYWDGPIKEGHFRFKYSSEYKKIDFDVPNGILNGSEITSVMTDWDGNGTYSILVDTGVRYHGGAVSFFFILIEISIIVVLLLIVFSIIVLYLYKRKRQKRNK